MKHVIGLPDPHRSLSDSIPPQAIAQARQTVFCSVYHVCTHTLALHKLIFGTFNFVGVL